MSVVFIILAVLCALVGLVGSIVPALPGPPLGWLALLFVHLSGVHPYTSKFLMVMLAVAVVITVIDYVVPVWGTKHFGGTKAGTRGSTVGLVVSVIVLPLLGITLGPFGIVGILAGPFIGAYVGEQIGGNSQGALRAAWGSFVGFLSGVLMKLAYTVVTAVYVFKDLIF